MKTEILKWRESMALLNEKLGSVIEEFELEYGDIVKPNDIALALTNICQMGFTKKDGSWHPALDRRYAIRATS